MNYTLVEMKHYYNALNTYEYINVRILYVY